MPGFILLACSECRDVAGLFARVSISLALKLMCWIFRDTSTVLVHSHGRRRKTVSPSDTNNAYIYSTVCTSSQVVCRWNNTRFFHMAHSLTHIDRLVGCKSARAKAIQYRSIANFISKCHLPFQFLIFSTVLFVLCQTNNEYRKSRKYLACAKVSLNIIWIYIFYFAFCRAHKLAWQNARGKKNAHTHTHAGKVVNDDGDDNNNANDACVVQSSPNI